MKTPMRKIKSIYDDGHWIDTKGPIAVAALDQNDAVKWAMAMEYDLSEVIIITKSRLINNIDLTKNGPATLDVYWLDDPAKFDFNVLSGGWYDRGKSITGNVTYNHIHRYLV